MKYIFLLIFLGLVALSVFAMRWNSGTRKGFYWVTDNNPARKEQCAAFERYYKQKTGQTQAIHVDYNNAGTEKIIVQAQGGIGGDIMDVYGIGMLNDLVRAKVLEPIDPAWARDNKCDPSFSWPSAYPQLVVDGQQYTFPCNVNADVMFWNKRILREAGVTLPHDRTLTWEDYRQIGLKIAKHRANGTLAEPFFSMSLNPDLLVWQCGGWFFNQTGTRCTLASPEAERGWKIYYDMIEVDHILPTPSEKQAAPDAGGWNAEQNLFLAGRVATYSIGRWFLIKLRTAQYARDGEGEWIMDAGHAKVLDDALDMDVTLIPIDAVRREQVYQIASRSAGINAKSPRKREAREFLAFLASEEYNQIINRGADAMPPNPPETSSKPNQALYRYNPMFPLETPAINDAFIEATKYGRSAEISPFVAAGDVLRITESAWDRVIDHKSTIREALQQAQDEIHKIMEENKRYNPELRKLYEERTKMQTEIDAGTRPDPRKTSAPVRAVAPATTRAATQSGGTP